MYMDINAPGIDAPAIETRAMNFWYGSSQAVYDVDMKIRKNRVTAIIGPSGCGKIDGAAHL